MAQRLQLYKCEVCGHIVMVFHGGGGTLTCCKQPMKALAENTTDAAQEKHVPVVEKVEGGYKVKVGSVAHPMEANHYIEWIELLTEDTMSCRFLKPEETPEAVFKSDAEKVHAREYCSVHGYWKGE